MPERVNEHKSRIYILGLDGATWNVIDPMIEKNQLPNIKRVIDGGVRSNLRSLEFTASPRVWTSIATGKVEQKHGILDFYNTIRDLKAKRFWNILQEKRDETANIFYWYLSWPPPKDFKDIMVPGFLARDSRTIPEDLGFLKDIELTQKMKLQESYDKTGIGYYIKQALAAKRNGVRLSTMMKAASFMVGRKFRNYSELESFLKLQYIKFHLHTDVFSHLLKTRPTDISAIMLPQTDQLGHKFWSFMQPEEFEKRTGVKVDPALRNKYGNVIHDTYRKIDKFVGEVFDIMSEDDVLILLSDHGFGLVDEIFASLKIKSKDILETVGLKDAAHCVTIGSSYIIQIDDPKRKNEIEQIAAVFRNIKIVDKEQPIFNVKTNEQEIVLELQDLFLMNIDDANDFLGKKIQVGDKVVPAETIFVNRADITGVHEELGVLIMNGKNIRKNASISETFVCDIMPTILYLRDLPVGKDMDGKVITEAIEPSLLKEREVQFIDTYETDEQSDKNDDEDFSMTDDLESRLESLGYL
ncbi:hypothetical protein GF337_06245 [candidate division KSB1 bacterium]|nr:hypothetical protein [candidate division KSB1 bacterium]